MSVRRENPIRRFLLLALAVSGCAPADPRAPALERRLYVAHKSGLTVYDIAAGHAKLRRIEMPGFSSFKGIAASIPLEALFLTANSTDELICFDLATERIRWRRACGAYLDSPAITPDGQTLYVPCRHGGEWRVLRARDGEPRATLQTGRGAPYEADPINDYGPHNTVASADGRRMYLSVMTIPYVFVADIATQKIVGRVGPFSRGVRPFAVNSTHLFANVDGLLGFEVADLRTGARIHRIEAAPPRDRIGKVADPSPHHHTPSHGIALRPGSTELWVSDDVHGLLYVYDVSCMPPRHLADVPLYESPDQQPRPGWISFSIDGRFAYASCNRVVDAERKSVAAKIDTSERLLEIQFEQGRAVRAGCR